MSCMDRVLICSAISLVSSVAVGQLMMVDACAFIMCADPKCPLWRRVKILLVLPSILRSDELFAVAVGRDQNQSDLVALLAPQAGGLASMELSGPDDLLARCIAVFNLPHLS